MDHLWDALTRGEHGAAKLHCWGGSGFDVAPWTEVVDDAHRVAAGLRRHGVRDGAGVATVLTNSPGTVRGVLGTWLAGGTLASLPAPAAGMDAAAYRDQLGLLCGQIEPSVFVANERLGHVIPSTLDPGTQIAAWESLGREASLDPSPPALEDVAFIQYSSGSTSNPKGCMLTPRAMAAQLEMIREAVDGRPGRDVVCSWLPLSHDMGFFGCLLYAWAWDLDLFLSSPERFMRAPRTWFADMADVGCTQTAGTNSALHLAARAQRRTPLTRRLKLRTIVVGAERVEAQTLAAVQRTFGPSGLGASALQPAYGLAEATLAVTALPCGEPPRVRTVDAVALADGEVQPVDGASERATALVSLGPPCAGVELRFGQHERMSEVYVRSPSLFSGYKADPQRTRERLHDDELATGDLGFLHEGELYLVGRTDDLLSVGGRNVYAHEIETAVGGLDALRKGAVTMVETPTGATPRLTMLIEVRDRRLDFAEISATVSGIVATTAGINLDECVFLPRGTLPKTPTGKIQRFRCRQLVMDDPLGVVARVCTSGPGAGSPSGFAEVTRA